MDRKTIRKIESTVNCDSSGTSYNSAWISGYKCLADEILNVVWDKAKGKYIVSEREMYSVIISDASGDIAVHIFGTAAAAKAYAKRRCRELGADISGSKFDESGDEFRLTDGNGWMFECVMAVSH